MFCRFRSPLLLAVAAVFLLALGPSGAAAAEGDQHCVAHASKKGTADPAEFAPIVCFATFPQAISHATGGAVVLPDDQTVLWQSDLDAASSMFATVISVEYRDAGYSGATLTYSVQNPNGCLDGSRYSDSYIDDAYWRNSISSAIGYQGCQGRHWDNPSFTGSNIVCTCSSMGAMNDRTESIDWY